MTLSFVSIRASSIIHFEHELTLPAPQAEAGSKRKRRTSADASKVQTGGESAPGSETPDSKRVRVNGNGTGSAEEDASEEHTGPGRLLSKEVRDAIAVVVAQ